MSMTLAEKIAVMQAAVRGETIECAINGREDWELNLSPAWNWDQFDYRVKPQPKVIWVNEYEDGGDVLHPSEVSARTHAGLLAIRTAVKYVEAQD